MSRLFKTQEAQAAGGDSLGDVILRTMPVIKSCVWDRVYGVCAVAASEGPASVTPQLIHALTCPETHGFVPLALSGAPESWRYPYGGQSTLHSLSRRVSMSSRSWVIFAMSTTQFGRLYPRATPTHAIDQDIFGRPATTQEV
jgi:hypothetical protein